jgi:UDP-2,4-diacetamido-2,4,6-trideoxy-beta-L-altropyranose hydrolase
MVTWRAYQSRLASRVLGTRRHHKKLEPMKPMSVLLRADASSAQGTGHVMRCLTLAEELIARGHAVTLWAHIDGLVWLSKEVEHSKITHESQPAHSLDIDQIRENQFNWVVVDSYKIESAQISALNRECRVLAIIDSDHRNIDATLYLDQNLGTETAFPPETNARQLMLGSDYALVRDGFLQHRSTEPSTTINGTAHVVVFFGGSDPDGAVVSATRSILAANSSVRLTVVCAERWISDIEQVCAFADAAVLALTPDLPHILSTADVVVSAAGTSAWDVCTLGRASVFVAVVDNQLPSLTQIQRHGIALTLDATASGANALNQVGALVSRLLGDERQRSTFVSRCNKIFDGKGKSRVVDRMEGALRL